MKHEFIGKIIEIKPRESGVSQSGKGTWDKNPWVFVYKFDLID